VGVDQDEALSLYVRERALVVKRLKELSAEDWQRTAEDEAFSHYSVYIMFRHLLMHEMLHAYRIDELMLKKIGSMQLARQVAATLLGHRTGGTLD
jgi:hypothetical protein